jgi:hypothetical protein
MKRSLQAEFHSTKIIAAIGGKKKYTNEKAICIVDGFCTDLFAWRNICCGEQQSYLQA